MSHAAVAHAASSRTPLGDLPVASCAGRFVLLVERASAPARSAAELAALAVPPGVAYLDPGGTPLALAPRPASAAACALEALSWRGRPRLLLLAPPAAAVRQNGAPVPSLALLDVADRVQLGGAAAWVSYEKEGGARAPSAEELGSPCGLCRLPLTARTMVYGCACGLALHLEGPERPAAERLACAALVGDCPSCGAAVRTAGGPVWLPGEEELA